MLMLDTKSPIDTSMRIPENLKEDQPHFGPDRLAEAQEFYEE